MLRDVLSSTIHDIDDTFLLAGVGFSRYAQQRSGANCCIVSTATFYYCLNPTFLNSERHALDNFNLASSFS